MNNLNVKEHNEVINTIILGPASNDKCAKEAFKDVDVGENSEERREWPRLFSWTTPEIANGSVSD